MFFVAVGLVISALDVFEVSIEMSLVKTLAELTLVIILFTDASMVQFNKLYRYKRDCSSNIGLSFEFFRQTLYQCNRHS